MDNVTLTPLTFCFIEHVERAEEDLSKKKGKEKEEM